MSAFPPPPTLRAQQEERSRDSSTHAAHAIPRPVNLPPLSSIDPRQHRPSPSPSPAEAPSHLHQPALTAYVPQYGTLLPSMSPYYGSQLNASGQYVGGPSVPTAVSSAASRFLITPTSDPNSIIAGGRHKKEVKKRTKTGCMTCRKRRIKCDEGHPACRNCVKSKRECLGYDPIFKSQSPSSIQPAPHLQSPGPANAASQLHHSSYASRATLSRPESSTIESSPAPFDRADFPPHLHDVHLGRATSVATSTDTMDDSNTRSDSRERARLDDQIIRRATQTNIDDLCWIDDQAGTPVSASAHHESQNSEALRTIYHTSLAPGLDRLLETPWFSANGYVSLTSDRSLLTQFENYVAAIPNASSVANQEARLVWALLCMCRRRPLPGFAGEFINDREDALDGDEVAEKRLDILEALITCRQSASNPLAGSAAPPPPNPSTGPATLAQQLQTREQNFWFHVGEFVSTSNTDAHAIERILSKSRKLLDNFENRDVIYSIMLMQRIGDKWHDKQIDEADDERDTKDWLEAKGFLESEAQGQAMNIVMKRICSMALRAWST